MAKKPRGYFENVLAFDCETSGIAFNALDPTQDSDGFYQMVSLAFIVTDVKTYTKVIDKLYLEIQWNGESKWSTGAENVHGLTKDYLSKNGVTEEEAAVQVGNFLIKHFGTQCIKLLGHNVATFDRYFLSDLMSRYGIPVKFGNRHIDTFALAMGTVGAFNSDDLFETMGMEDRKLHNAMEDIEYTMKSAARIKKLWDAKVGLEAY